ncbi:hypothetical protein N5D52_19375 [Pseudomonas sp. GD03860]|uniref:hypothetical protein n=1 Tax=Pseudomonas sp. GD03860 TaxID=2975389 RepID=UPI0024473C40|nr:hypothetical protein [Pseudomonas sp. GD03860]MDH0639101.1 hypothetical protein [Pseudomonas sp. GD03860]
MAVPAGPTSKRHTGNGVTTIFTVPFLVIQASDLAVFVDGVRLTSGYAQTGVGNPTSTVTFSVAPVLNTSILLQLDVPFERLNDYQENGDFLASTLNRDFDRIWQALKQLLRWSGRSLRLDENDIDGQGWYRAKGNGIRDLRNPVEDQDATPKRWVEQYVGEVLQTGTGPLNLASNVLYIDPKGVTRTVQDMSSTVNSALGAGIIGWVRSSMADAVSNHKTVGARLSFGSINLLEFSGLVTAKPDLADPETWDWAPAFDALTAASRSLGMDIELPPMKLKTSKTFVVPAGVIARGKGGGGYITEIVDPVMWKTVITKINGNTGGSYVVDVEQSGQLWDVQVAPENRGVMNYLFANYPAGSGNVSNGVRLQQASRANGVTAIAFPVTGFEIGMITKCTDCYAFMCTNGYKTRTGEGDASIVECVAMFNCEYGADLRGGYWKVIGGRFEWNARHGVGGSSTFTCTGATFDRNGWAGLYLPQGLEQCTVTGNTFRRNGAGGDGAYGRTGAITPSHPGYVFTSNENSCHIRIDAQRRVEITGNTYSPGKDDAGLGADAPKYVYTSGLSTGSVPLDGLIISGNHGDRFEASPGYAPTYNGGGAATFGGNDATLISYYNATRGTYMPMSVRSEVFQGGVPQTTGAVVNIAILVPKNTSGKVIVSMRQAFAAELAEVYFAVSTGNGSPATKIVNQFGTNVTSAVLAAAAGDFNTLTLTFAAACFVKASVFTS